MIRVTATRLFRTELRTRLPFRYGIATMTQAPHVFLHVTCELDGKVQDGISADHLPPKWFTKDPARDPAGEIGEMLQVIEQAMSAADGINTATVFGFWRKLYDRQSAWGAAAKLPPLLVHFGTSLVERAVLDAFARARATALHRLLHDDALGLDLGAFHPALAGSRPANWLPAVPLSHIIARHTVGLADPLTEGEIAPSERLTDGLPQSLKECIRAYGLRHFKIKINGQPEGDMDRLERIAALFDQHAPADYAFSLDGNESFRSAATFRDFWAGVTRRPKLVDFVRHLLFVEQPLHRDIALDESAGAWTRDWPEHPPIIIDESDAELDSLHRALDLGYAGTSHKNCKGVFKGIANACRIVQLKRERPGAALLMSGEDLSNIGPVALLQDLAVHALLGISSVERNGHHYFAGLSCWPPSWQASVLARHPELYLPGANGWPRLNIRGGGLCLDSVNAAPFGTDFPPALLSELNGA
jgi:L-alanine-DL-glutamate epimerase-like enolase superfamily enzyme